MHPYFLKSQNRIKRYTGAAIFVQRLILKDEFFPVQDYHITGLRLLVKAGLYNLNYGDYNFTGRRGHKN